MRSAGSGPVKHGLAPIIAPNARVLILGSLPGDASIEAGEYYAHPRNDFWRLMAEVIGDSRLPQRSYVDRVAVLSSARIGVWDVFTRARRSGSLDAAIVDAETSDVVGLARSLPLLSRIGFNGQLAAKQRAALAEITCAKAILPSSSPTNTQPFAAKAEAWLRALS